MFERKTYQLIIITSQRFTKEKEIKRKELYYKNFLKFPTKPLDEFPINLFKFFKTFTQFDCFSKYKSNLTIRQKQPPVFYKKGVLNFAKFIEKYLYLSLFFIKVAGLSRPYSATLLKKRF